MEPTSPRPAGATKLPPEPRVPPAPVPASWPDPEASLALTVVKLAADGSIVTEYPGAVVPGVAPAPWLAVEAIWRNRLVVLDGLEFHPGDTLLEFFSPDAWFNVFAVHAPGGALRGWYANVTYPIRFDPAPAPPRLTWHDLFLDVVVLPDGRRSIRDEDELAASGIADADPVLHARILAGRDAILERVRCRIFPFDRDGDEPPRPPDESDLRRLT